MLYSNREKRFLKHFACAYYITKNARLSTEIAADITGTVIHIANQYANKFGANSHNWRALIDGADYGTLYIFKEDGSRMFKVGSTKQINSRFKTLQSGNPNTLTIEVDCGAYFYRELEKTIHHIFSLNRIRGEWFYFGIEDFESLKNSLVLNFPLSKVIR